MPYLLLACLLFPGNCAVFLFNGSTCNVVILGSGGMHMVDPLFQRVLVNECRSKKIPVIFDEVFTGFWRLGTEVGCSLVTFHSIFPLFLIYILDYLLIGICFSSGRLQRNYFVVYQI